MKITHTSLTASKESINCSALDDISGFLKKISKSLWTNLLSLSTEGIDVDKSEQGKNGTFYLRATTKRGNKFAVKCSPVSGKSGHYDLFFLTNKGMAPEMRQDVAETDIAKIIGKWAHEYFDRDSGKLSELTDDAGADKLNPNTETTTADTAGTEQTAEGEQ